MSMLCWIRLVRRSSRRWTPTGAARVAASGDQLHTTSCVVVTTCLPASTSSTVATLIPLKMVNGSGLGFNNSTGTRKVSVPSSVYEWRSHFTGSCFDLHPFTIQDFPCTLPFTVPATYSSRCYISTHLKPRYNIFSSIKSPPAWSVP